MKTQDIAAKIRAHRWDNRVQRPGFLQPKTIINEGEIKPLELTSGITVGFDNLLWVKESNLYDEEAVEMFLPKFQKAFDVDPSWPHKIVELFHAFAQERDALQQKLSLNWANASPLEMMAAFKTYVALLQKIQQYYVIAVPLTNFCEGQLREKAPALLNFATSYERLDVDKLNDSLKQIQQIWQSDKAAAEEKIQQHLREFGWIKTAYNIIEPYTRDDVLSSLENTSDAQTTEALPPTSEYSYLLDALRIGIFLRNRMKELSQQVWYAANPLLIAMGAHVDLSREDFLQLQPAEVVASFEKGKSTVSAEQIQERHQGFIQGYLNRQEVLVTGPVVEELFQHYNKFGVQGVSEIRGTPACRGFVQGTVRLIKGSADFAKLEKGDVLVTSMTTPDFVVIMKKAGAIVTDEGGLSCHAAIVSRELGIPCVIGTKIATKVLKDGDQVEVDANKGIVRKL